MTRGRGQCGLDLLSMRDTAYHSDSMYCPQFFQPHFELLVNLSLNQDFLDLILNFGQSWRRFLALFRPFWQKGLLVIGFDLLGLNRDPWPEPLIDGLQNAFLALNLGK